MKDELRWKAWTGTSSLLTLVVLFVAGCLEYPPSVETNAAVKSQQWPRIAYNTKAG